jgi:cell wall-associated NlpC family hydrolase
MQRPDIVAAAKLWIDTPWMWQGRMLGVGVDCLGLLVGVCSHVDYPLVARSDYKYPPNPKEIEEGLKAQFDEIDDVRLGAVLHMADMTYGVHLGICSGNRVIHAHAPSRKVVENDLTQNWPGEVIGIYDFKGVVD